MERRSFRSKTPSQRALAAEAEKHGQNKRPRASTVDSATTAGSSTPVTPRQRSITPVGRVRSVGRPAQRSRSTLSTVSSVNTSIANLAAAGLNLLGIDPEQASIERDDSNDNIDDDNEDPHPEEDEEMTPRGGMEPPQSAQDSNASKRRRMASYSSSLESPESVYDQSKLTSKITIQTFVGRVMEFSKFEDPIFFNIDDFIEASYQQLKIVYNARGKDVERPAFGGKAVI